MLLVKEAPHLAFIEPERYDRVVRLVKRRNEKYRRGIAANRDPRQGRLRSDTRWPGQHLRCGICGRKFVFGGHGRKTRMMCDGARSYRCWNALTVDGPEVARAVAEQVRRHIESLPDFDAEWRRRVESEAKQLSREKNAELLRLQHQRDACERQIENLTGAISHSTNSRALVKSLEAKEQNLDAINDKIDEVRQGTEPILEVPPAEKLREIAREAFAEMATESREFRSIMLDLVTEFYVLPYRLVDGGHIEPRCIFSLDMASLPECPLPPGLEAFRVDCFVDLTKPTQRVSFRERVVQLRTEGMKYSAIADRLSITSTAAQRAASLHRELQRQNLSDPWLPVTTAEEAAANYKRVRSKRFKFKPLSGFPVKFPELRDKDSGGR